MVRTALVTGGTGFVGANLALRLLGEGHAVALLVRPGCATWRIQSFLKDVRLIEADLENADAVERALAAVRPEWIFHLATYGAYPAQLDLQRTIATNIVGTVNLVQGGLKVGFEALVNAGSSSEYGYTSHAPAESDLVEPNSAYAWAKMSASSFCRFSALRHGVKILTLRLYSVFGPFEEPSRLMPTLISRGLRGELPPLADPATARDYVYVDDVTDALRLAASRHVGDPGAIYNVGTGVQSTLCDVVNLARRHLPIRQEPRWGSMANRSWDATVWVCDHRKITEDLGWAPRYSLEDGFVRFIDWFAAHPGLAAHYAFAAAGPP